MICFFRYTQSMKVLFLQKEKFMFSRIKGAADNFFDMPTWSSVIRKIEAHIKQYNFSQIDIPLLEHVALFERGLGFETDVVSKQMFLIQPKNNETSSSELMCLRPEATAGTMRAFLELQSKIHVPFNVFCYGPMFRYERPQKGRLRQFHQFNLECIGATSILYDAQFIAMLHLLFSQTLSMKQVVLKLNFLGTTDDRKAFQKSFVDYLQNQKNNLCETCQVRLNANPLRILDCKSESCKALCKNAPTLSTFFSNQSLQEWNLLQTTLKELSVPFELDPSLVRGLDYYNKTVFEFVSTALGAQNAFCGGGRYDGLAEQLGSKNHIPALGCAIGLERLMMILQEENINLNIEKQPLICIIPIEPEQNNFALRIATILIKEQAQSQVQVLFDGAKMKHKMKQANDLAATWVILLGDQEEKNNQATIKNMITGDQKTVSIEALKAIIGH